MPNFDNESNAVKFFDISRESFIEFFDWHGMSDFGDEYSAVKPVDSRGATGELLDS